MTNLTRKQQKVFAENAVNNGQFGSLQDTSKVLSQDLDVLQANIAYLLGWNNAALTGEELPSLEEFQALNYINTSQIAYLLNKGIPEWEASTEYFIGDIQREVTGTKLYRSEVDNNIGLDIAAIAYNAGTTYEIDEVAMDTNGDIYRSLTGGNIGNPLTDPVNWELAWKFLVDLANTGTKLSGDTVQFEHNQTGAVATGATLSNLDDTIPQNNEGNEFITQTITPSDALNDLFIEGIFVVSQSTGLDRQMIVGLFQDSVVDALASVNMDCPTGDSVTIPFRHKIPAIGTTSPIDFKIRIGMAAAGTVTLNGVAGVRRMGGVMASSLTIKEIKV